MSSSIVRKALQIVDEENNRKPKKQRKQWKSKDILGGGKLKDLRSSTKLTLMELRKSMKPKEEILKNNMERLELIRSVTAVKLKEEALNKIIERGVEKRPISGKPKVKESKDEGSVFTEEDFRKFEEEYTGE